MITRTIIPCICLSLIAVFIGDGGVMPARAQGPGVGYARVPQGAYSVVAEVRAKPGKEAELRAVTLPLVALVRSDPKNLVYFLQEDRQAPGHFVFYEIFANQADFDAHNAKPYVQAWFAKLPALADGGVKAMRLEILNGPHN
jgi:quinol monooxygenase YgiN